VDPESILIEIERHMLDYEKRLIELVARFRDVCRSSRETASRCIDLVMRYAEKWQTRNSPALQVAAMIILNYVYTSQAENSALEKMSM